MHHGACGGAWPSFFFRLAAGPGRAFYVTHLGCRQLATIKPPTANQHSNQPCGFFVPFKKVQTCEVRAVAVIDPDLCPCSYRLGSPGRLLAGQL